VCNCSAGISGLFCEEVGFPPIKSSKLGINKDEILIIAAVILGVVLIVSMFVVVIYCRRRKKRSRHREVCYCAAPDREYIDNIHCKVKNIDEPQHQT
jgi:heme/copper-type cytochrome/quinol oxidase subunit 2